MILLNPDLIYTKVKYLRHYKEAINQQNLVDDDMRHSINYLVMVVMSGNVDYELEKDLDRLFNETDVYYRFYNYLVSSIEIFKKYDYDDIDDHLVEFYDRMLKFRPFLYFSLHIRFKGGGESWENFNREKDYYKKEKNFWRKLAKIISDGYHFMKSNTQYNLKRYLEELRPSLFIRFNDHHGRLEDEYDLLYLEEIADDIVDMLRRVYGNNSFGKVYFPYHREERYYDPSTLKVKDYDLTIELN